MRPAVRIGAAATLAVLLLIVGVVVGITWERGHSDDRSPTAVDVGFNRDMSTHHDQAILMSQIVGARPSVGPEISSLAQRIIVAQTAEAATMRSRLTWFGEPLTATDRPMSWMPMPANESHAHGAAGADDGRAGMPGMASTDDIGRLSTAAGRDAEILFLQLMIRHHRGGMAMAQAAHNSPDASTPTRQLALSMIGDQGDEVGQMTLLLRARGAQPLPV